MKHSRENSPEPPENSNRRRRHNPPPASKSKLDEAKRLFLRTEDDMFPKVTVLINSDSPLEKLEDFYAPFFKELAEVVVGTDEIPVPPAKDYLTDFLIGWNPTFKNTQFSEGHIQRLVNYIMNEHKKQLHQQYYKPPSNISEAVKSAWKTTYMGTSHVLLRDAVEDMYKGSKHKPYANFCAIIQGSGTGKSRLVDKLAESIFTIPMVLRPHEDKTGFPLSDTVGNQHLVDYFCTNFGHSPSALHVQRAYLHFLLGTIAFAENWLDNRKNLRTETVEPIAAQWRKFLGPSGGSERREMYKDAMNQSVEKFKDILDERIDDNSIQVRVKTYIDSVSSKLGSAGVETKPTIIFYFDEAHHLTNATVTADGIPKRTAYQCLCKAFTYMMDAPVFGLFLSTYSRLSNFAPSARNFWSSRPEADSEPSDDHMNAPFVELPFDSWKKPMLVVEGTHSAKEICSLKFMARFGRPLFWALFEGSDALRDQQVLENAISKLVLRYDGSDLGKGDYPIAELIPSLAIRVDLTFESNRDEAVLLERLLIASSMRTVYSVPQHRQYLCGGYSSEPLVAEAAAQTIFRHCRIEALGNNFPVVWTPEAMNKVIKKYKNVVPLAVATWCKHGLISKGTRGELVARILFTLAHDISILKNPDFRNDLNDHRNISFSQMIPVVDFLSALISEEKIEEVLDMQPANDSPGLTLREAFKDGFVHFAHYIKAGDISTITDEAAFAFISRGAAVQGYQNMPDADLFIPVWFRRPGRDCPDRWSMSGIFAQIKDCIDEQFIFIDVHKTFEFFTPSDRKVDNQRPYITIVMELGVLAPSQRKAREPTVKRTSKIKSTVGETASMAKKKKGKGKEKEKEKGKEEKDKDKGKEKEKEKEKNPQTDVPETSLHRPDRLTPAEVEIPSRQCEYLPRNAKGPNTHPRYDIKIIGCSERVYNVVGDFSYSSLLAHKDLLAEHPRANKQYHDAITDMKPYWLQDTSYKWTCMRNKSRLGAPVVDYEDEANGEEVESDDGEL